jgi:anti-anti-sigma factor
MPPTKKRSAKKSPKSTAKRKKAINVIKPGNDIVASTADDFRGMLLNSVNKGTKELILDLSGVEVVDSVGLGMIIATHNSLKNAGGKLKVIRSSENIFRLFQTMRLDQHFELHPANG